jgi:ubiquinone/menaquinone biosynthesis C-methylase UbiE
VEGKRVRVLLQLLDCQPHHRVLDVGVGAGNILERVRARERVGLDLSSFLLKRARERLGDSVLLIKGDAEELLQYVERHSFDRLYCSEVLEHLENPARALAQMAEALKPDGIAVVSVPNDLLISRLKALVRSIGMGVFLPRALIHAEGQEWHLHNFTPAQLRSICEPFFVMERLFAIPSIFLPLRYVALLRPRSSPRGVPGSSPPVPVDLKEFFKVRSPRLYNVLFHLVGPSLLTGLTSRRFVRCLPPDVRILHAGSGTKRLPREHAVNVDLQPLPGVDIVADLARLPFPDASFDAVTCEQVLEHVQDPPMVVRELLRVTRPGGLVHLASPFLLPYHPSPGDYTRWTQEGLRALFRDCELLEEGVMAGPFSTLTAVLAAFLATVLSFGSRRLQAFLQYLFLVLFIPLKLPDFLFAHLPGAELCASNFYIVVRK